VGTRNALISGFGLNGKDAMCQQAVRLFAELYGAEADNLVLKAFATSGIGVGIAPKIRTAMQSQDFVGKGRFRELLSTIPVRLALNPKTALIGAMHYFQ